MKSLFSLILVFFPALGFSQVKQLIVPDTLPPVTKMYSQAVVVQGGRTIYVAGQVPVDSKGRLVGKNDFGKQVEQVFTNLEYVLKSAGASMEDLVKITYHVVGLDSNRLQVFREVARKHTINAPPVSTLLGVNALYNKDVWIEVDAIAVTDDMKNPKATRFNAK